MKPGTLQRLPDGDLRCQLGLAQTTLRFGQSYRFRLKAVVDIEAIRAELAKRGVRA